MPFISLFTVKCKKTVDMKVAEMIGERSIIQLPRRPRDLWMTRYIFTSLSEKIKSRRISWFTPLN
jgi:hypothetical protein